MNKSDYLEKIRIAHRRLVRCANTLKNFADFGADIDEILVNYDGSKIPESLTEMLDVWCDQVDNVEEVTNLVANSFIENYKIKQEIDDAYGPASG